MRRGSVRGLNFGRRRKKINVPLLKEIGTWVIEIAIVPGDFICICIFYRTSDHCGRTVHEPYDRERRRDSG